MTNVGTVFKQVRRQKELTLNEVEEQTKIKAEFVGAIEKISWNKLPEYAVVAGFVKNLATFYGLDRSKMLALLRRDYPPKDLPINPQPDLEDRKIVWQPRFTFFIGVFLIILVVVGYLGYQYYLFTRPPRLEIFVPNENQIVYLESLTVTGKTTQDSSVKVNNQPALVGSDGTFKAEILVDENTQSVEIKAVSRSGKETVEIRNIQVELDK